jgi:hypothetical protein
MMVVEISDERLILRESGVSFLLGPRHPGAACLSTGIHYSNNNNLFASVNTN